MKLRFLNILLFFIVATTLLGQSLNDSLINAYKAAIDKEQRIKVIQEFIENKAILHPDTILKYTKIGIRQCDDPIYYQQKSLFIKTLAEIYEDHDSIFKAIEQYQKYAVINQKLENKKEEALAYNNIGNIYFRIADYTQALTYHLKSNDLREEIEDKEGIGSSLNNIGTIYVRQEKYDKALDYFNRSLELEHENENEPGIASCYINIGIVYEKKESYDTALNYYLNSIEINKEYENTKDIAYTYSNIALIFFTTGDLDTSLTYYLQSLNLFESVDDQFGLAETNLAIGIYYNELLERKKAIEYLDKSMAIGKEIRSYDIVMRSAKELSEAHALLKDYEKAYTNYITYKRAEDAINNVESGKKFTRLEMQHEFEQVEKEKEYKRKLERRRQTAITAFFIVGFTFMLILAFVIYRGYKRKLKDNILLAKQKEEIQHQRDEITASIQYASRIQKAVLPPLEFREKILPEHFILNKPRDIVSGDYFWMTQKGAKTLVAAADCTGHGVPGAFMSMLGVTFLNEIVGKPNVHRANEILYELREYIIKSLHQTGKDGEQKDGMDMALVSLDRKKNKVEFAGAYNPLYHVSDGVLEEVKADRMPIGIFMTHEPFTNQTIDVKPGDTLYIFSDGYVDQFGGEEGKKFKAKPFKDLLISIQDKSMEEQREILDTTIEEWKDGYSQIDDILIIGIRV